jgi:hypothetical protein
MNFSQNSRLFGANSSSIFSGFLITSTISLPEPK